MHKFETEVCRKGYITFAWIPEKVSRVFTKKGHIPVKGFIKDIAFKGMLGPRQGGLHILYLNADLRKSAQINVGDFIEIKLDYDPESRAMEIPEDLELIMSENREVWQRFLGFSQARRNELLKYLATAKRPETRLKRIEKIIEHTIRWKSGETYFS